MENIKEKLFEALNNESHDFFNELMRKYVKQGYGVDYEMLSWQIMSLIRTRQFDRAYHMTKWLEKTTNNPDINYDLVRFYNYTNRPAEAERILNTRKVNVIHGATVVRVYLRLGKIDKAKELVDYYLQFERNSVLIELKKEIFNHEHFGAFIPVDYRSFIKSGNKLDCGYIVLLKNKPNNLNDRNDPKAATRPYFVWKVEDGKAYLFPVTTSGNGLFYKLKKENYPNCKYERSLCINLCSTPVDNIVTVTDKVLDEDVKESLRLIYNSLYLHNSGITKKASDVFMQGYYEKPKMHDVIKVVDGLTRENKYYFVIGVKDEYYDVIEVAQGLKVVSNRVEMFRNDRLVSRVINLTNEQIAKLKEQIPGHVLVESLLGAKVETYLGRYIVLNEGKEYVACISYPFSPSYIVLKAFKKSDIRNTYGFISEEEVEDIKAMLERNGKNLNSLIKKGK